MKSFKDFIQLDEIKQPKYAHGEEGKFAKSTYMAEPKDPADQLKSGPEEIGLKDTKLGQGKRRADRLDNKQPFDEENLSPKETKMAHTIGKEFNKKNVGNGSKGSAYAIATSMVKNKPESAQKAYNTIKAKMKEDVDATEILFSLYENLSTENQEVFLAKLESDSDALLDFATISKVE
jgi:hypothetical protein